jgi:multiple sugar transport system ATP-binding protein
MAGVDLKTVSKRWGGFTAVDRLDLTIHDREFLVLLGPSGCGKTTTMRMVAGLEECSSGEIYIGERCVNDLAPKDRDIAMVFQNYGLYPHMTVRQNIGYPLKVRNVPKAQHPELIQRAAERVELAALLDRKPRALSGGQRQRVALARAIVREPTVFLMDEPLSNLDAKLRVSMRAEIKHLQHELAVTTIYVTHDQIEAMTLAHRVAVMNHGVIQQLATPQDIYNDPDNLFVAGFIGSPAMNLIRGELVEGEFQAEGIRVPGVGRGSRRDVVFGARSEDMTVSDSGGGDIAGPIYSVELTGENTLVTLDIGGQHIVARADRFYQNDIGNNVGVRVNKERCYLFDAGSELRIRTD